MNRKTLFQKSAAGLIVVGVSPTLLASCGGDGGSAATSGGTDASKPRRGGRLRVALHDGGAGDTLDPWNVPIYSAAARAKQVYERLFDFGPDGAPVARLAESAEPNADGTVWTVKLQSGVTFHDGKTMTAADVLYSFRYAGDPANKAAALSRLEPFDLDASRASSDLEVEFHLTRPVGDFPTLVADSQLWTVPEGATDFVTKPNGTGPFTFVSWQPGVRAIFKRNPNYWQSGKPYVDDVEMVFIPDPQARVNALLGRQVDEISSVDFVQAKAQEANSQIQLIRNPQPQCTPIYMQLDSPPFNDVRVREALKLAVDRDAMVEQANLGFGSIGNDLFGKGLPTYNDDLPQRTYDPEKAAALLKEAGQEGLTFTLPTSDVSPGMLQSGTAYKEQAKAAGITVNIERLEAGSYFANNKYLKVPVYQTGWGQSFESQAVDGLLRNSPYNETHWYSKSWSEAFLRAQAITDADERIAAYKDLQEPLWREGGYVIFSFSDTVDAAAANVRGIPPMASSGYSNLGGFDFKDHWLTA
jgi:peptide/nickel transport system substrate-binding protein